MRDLKLENCRLDGRYDIREQLGRGSYAEIYIAEDSLAATQSPHKLVVIKALNVFLQNDLDADLERTLVENFQNEAIALDSVRHPNIISRLGHGTSRDLNGMVFHYLVLEYLPGGDLSRYCRELKIPFDEALDFIEQICAGIAHAHQNNVIHRDIKPQNILLTADKKIVKIADFGVARFAQSDSPVTRVGTNIYAPPEHSPMLSGQTGTLTFTKITPAADIYSLAKTAFVLFTSESPRYFSSHPISELPYSFRQESWAESLIKILTKATQNDARERYQTVGDFWKDLSTLRLLSDSSNPTDVVTHISMRKGTPPQPHVAKGYTPNTPVKPKFDTSRELQLKPHLTIGQQPLIAKEIDSNISIEKNQMQPEIVDENLPPTIESFDTESTPKKKFWNIAAIFLIFIGLFVGSLYATYSYLQGIFPSISFTSSEQMGTAITNINLRSAPTKNGKRIGLITKNSRVRVVNIDNNWYQIVIVEYGRPKRNSDDADRGWAYGRYIELDE